MNGTGRIVHEERFVRRHGLLSLHPANRLIRHVHREMVALRFRRGDPGDAVVDQGEPLVCFAADKTVELVEALTCRPPVKGTRYTCLPCRGLMPFSERTGAVPVQPQHLGQGCHAVGNLPGVAGKSRRTLHDRAGVRGVVIPPSLECHPGRRAECRGVEVIEFQPTRGKHVKRWRVDRAAERAGAAEANVVNQNDHDIGSILGRLDLEKGRRLLHIANIEFAIGRPFWLWNR